MRRGQTLQAPSAEYRNKQILITDGGADFIQNKKTILGRAAHSENGSTGQTSNDVIKVDFYRTEKRNKSSNHKNLNRCCKDRQACMLVRNHLAGYSQVCI
jgi:hypothetical protein